MIDLSSDVKKVRTCIFRRIIEVFWSKIDGQIIARFEN